MKPQRMNIAVLIVEDDAAAREILADWMNQASGFKCVGAYDSVEQALEHLPAENPAVVLMDINLPGLSGIEGVRRLKPLLPDTQFLMLTVYEDADHVFEALQAGAMGYLLKQTPRKELLEAIKDVFAGGSPMTSNIARRVVQAFHREDASLPESAKLSTREREVLELLARGYLYKEITDSLKVSRGTLNTYIRRTYEKLHVRSRSQAVAKFSHFSLNEPGSRSPKP
jgi:DNA-binding NarL/FixJ family response regulator